MIAGHYGLAAAVKARETTIPLWVLMLATAWLDVVFVPLFLGGLESFTPVPGTHGGYGANIIHADYSHSLIGAVALSGVFGWVGSLRWGARTGWVLAAVVFSHWLLDIVVHRGDMPILPADFGALPRLGFGLWRAPLVALLTELVLVVGGAWLYWRAARATVRQEGTRQIGGADLAGVLVLLCGLAVLTLDVTGLIG
jgi:membrane-bound metal-dependent hydrolase YbcI (DUF457 family)